MIDAEPLVDSGYSAIVLVGGRSSRMGRPKAALRLGSTTVIERIVTELHRVCDEIVVVAGPPSLDQPWLPKTRVTVRFDEEAFAGPVDALGRGFAAARSEICFACACDLPFVRAEVARALCTMVGKQDAAIAMIGGRAQVLCAAYQRVAALGAIARMGERGEKRLSRIAELLNVRWVSEAEMTPCDPELMSFHNLNTPEDYRWALARVAELK